MKNNKINESIDSCDMTPTYLFSSQVTLQLTISHLKNNLLLSSSTCTSIAPFEHIHIDSTYEQGWSVTIYQSDIGTIHRVKQAKLCKYDLKHPCYTYHHPTQFSTEC